MYTWNHNSACCLVFAMNTVSHIHVHSCTDQSDNVLLGPVPSTPLHGKHVFGRLQTNWLMAFNITDGRKAGSCILQKAGTDWWSEMSQRVWHPFYIYEWHDPLQEMCWQPTSQGDWGGTIATWLQFIATTRAFCLFTFSHISTKSKPEISNECFTSPL